MFDSCDAGDDGDEILPALLLGAERFAALRSQAVIAAAALIGLFHPAAGDPALLFEAVEQRVEGGNVEAQGAAGAELNQLGDVVAVAGLVFEQGEDEELGAAFFPVLIGSSYSSVPYMGYNNSIRARREFVP